MKELHILSNLKHRNVLSYKDAWVESGCVICLVVELCESGDLLTQLKLRLNNTLFFSEAHLQEMLVQVRNIMHWHATFILMAGPCIDPASLTWHPL